MDKSEEIKEKLVKIIVEKLGVEASTVTLSARFMDDLEADSLKQVEIFKAIESEFSIDISNEDLEQIKTVNDAVNCIDIVS